LHCRYGEIIGDTTAPTGIHPAISNQRDQSGIDHLFEINVEGLASGLYLVEIRTRDQLAHKKMVIQ